MHYLLPSAWCTVILFPADPTSLKVLDVGLNFGAFALFTASLKCEVWAFEMQPNIFTLVDIAMRLSGYRYSMPSLLSFNTRCHFLIITREYVFNFLAIRFCCGCLLGTECICIIMLCTKGATSLYTSTASRRILGRPCCVKEAPTAKRYTFNLIYELEL